MTCKDEICNHEEIRYLGISECEFRKMFHEVIDETLIQTNGEIGSS